MQYTQGKPKPLEQRGQNWKSKKTFLSYRLGWGDEIKANISDRAESK